MRLHGLILALATPLLVTSTGMTQEDVLCAVNEERARLKLRPLGLDKRLSNVLSAPMPASGLTDYSARLDEAGFRANNYRILSTTDCVLLRPCMENWMLTGAKHDFLLPKMTVFGATIIGRMVTAIVVADSDANAAVPKCVAAVSGGSANEGTKESFQATREMPALKTKEMTVASGPKVNGDELICELNLARSKRGLPPIGLNAKVGGAALREAEKRVRIPFPAPGFVESSTRELKIRDKKLQYGKLVGFNCSNAKACVDAWLGDANASKILLGTFSMLGVSQGVDQDDVAIVVSLLNDNKPPVNVPQC